MTLRGNDGWKNGKLECDNDSENDVPSNIPTFHLSPSVVWMCKNRLYQLIEHLRLRCDVAPFVGVHVPGRQLVQRGGLFIREVQHVAMGLCVRLVEHVLEHVGEMFGVPDGLVLLSGHREVHALILVASLSPATQSIDAAHTIPR